MSCPSPCLPLVCKLQVHAILLLVALNLSIVTCMQDFQLAPLQPAIIELHVEEPPQQQDTPAATGTKEAATRPYKDTHSADKPLPAAASSLSGVLQALMPAAALVLTSPATSPSKKAASAVSMSDRDDKTAEAGQSPGSKGEILGPLQLSITAMEDAVGEGKDTLAEGKQPAMVGEAANCEQGKHAILVGRAARTEGQAADIKAPETSAPGKEGIPVSTGEAKESVTSAQRQQADVGEERHVRVDMQTNWEEESVLLTMHVRNLIPPGFYGSDCLIDRRSILMHDNCHIMHATCLLLYSHACGLSLAVFTHACNAAPVHETNMVIAATYNKASMCR